MIFCSVNVTFPQLLKPNTDDAIQVIFPMTGDKAGDYKPLLDKMPENLKSLVDVDFVDFFLNDLKVKIDTQSYWQFGVVYRQWHISYLSTYYKKNLFSLYNARMEVLTVLSQWSRGLTVSCHPPHPWICNGQTHRERRSVEKVLVLFLPLARIHVSESANCQNAAWFTMPSWRRMSWRHAAAAPRARCWPAPSYSKGPMPSSANAPTPAPTSVAANSCAFNAAISRVHSPFSIRPCPGARPHCNPATASSNPAKVPARKKKTTWPGTNAVRQYFWTVRQYFWTDSH